MATFHELVKMSYDEFTSQKMDAGANTNTMTSVAMARLEKVINKFDKTSSSLSKVNIGVAILLGIIALLQLIVAFRR